MTGTGKVLGVFFAIATALVLAAAGLAVSALFEPEPAMAVITVGDNVSIEGWTANEMVSTDVQVNLEPAEMTSTMESAIIRFIKLAMPILMLACVLKIVWTAITNIFSRKKPEERVRMGDMIKNMFIQFFFILCSFLIVELIVFAVTNGETLLIAILMG